MLVCPVPWTSVWIHRVSTALFWLVRSLSHILERVLPRVLPCASAQEGLLRCVSYGVRAVHAPRVVPRHRHILSDILRAIPGTILRRRGKDVSPRVPTFLCPPCDHVTTCGQVLGVEYPVS